MATIAYWIEADIHDAFLSDSAIGQVRMTRIGEYWQCRAGRVVLTYAHYYAEYAEGRSDSPTRVSGAAMWSINSTAGTPLCSRSFFGFRRDSLNWLDSVEFLIICKSSLRLRRYSFKLILYRSLSPK
jgi:hypothetical protein